MHATRPVLLYMARHSRDSSGEALLGMMSPYLVRLAEICVENCLKTLAILKELRQRELFGIEIESNQTQHARLTHTQPNMPFWI